MTTRNPLRAIVSGLLLISFSVFLSATGAIDQGGDGAQSFYTLKHVLERRSLVIDGVGPNIGAVLARDGHYYSKFPPALAATELPYFVVLSAAGAVSGMSTETKEAMLSHWVPVLTNATLTSIVIGLLFFVVMQLGYSAKMALTMSVLAAFATPLWPYARSNLSEPLQTLLLLVIFWIVIRARPVPSIRDAFLAGLTLAFLISTKIVYVMVGPFALAALCWRQGATTPRTLLRSSVAFGLPVLAAVALLLGWNYLRFGAPFEFGYSEPFDTPLLVGLHGWFFSPGKSVFLYAPILVCAVVGLAAFYRRHPLELALIAGLTVPLVLLHCVYWEWSGEVAWATRYAVPLMPLWMLPAAAVLASGRIAARVAVAVLGALGLFVQVLGIAINPVTYVSLHEREIGPVVHPGWGPNFNQTLVDTHFIPEFSPLAGHWWLLKSAIEMKLSPGKDFSQYKALHDYPWIGRSDRVGWKPKNPEVGAVLDVWFVRPWPPMSRRMVAILASIMLAIGVAGTAFIVVGLQTLRREAISKAARGSPQPMPPT